MPSNNYHFITNWRIKSTREAIVEVLSDPLDLVRWWPSVYLDAQELRPGDEQGLGRVISLYTKGWLPYGLHWQFEVTEADPATRLAIKASGDFEGQGVWTFEQDGEWVNVVYDWQIHADKPLLKYLSPLIKPLFSANHHWAMTMGLKSLELELQRRQASSPQQLAQIPTPPPLVPQWPFVFGAVVIVVLLVWWGKPNGK